MTSRTLRAAFGGIAVAALASAASASSITPIIGYSPTQALTGDYAVARNAFLATGPTGVESFEDETIGAFPGSLDFVGLPISVGADFTASSLDAADWREVPRVEDTDPEGQGTRTPTDGEQFLYLGVNSGDNPTLTLDFDPNEVVRGFGFSISDLGDFGASITIRTTDDVVHELDIAPGANGLPSSFANGSRIWASFTTDVAIDLLEIELFGNGNDNFSFDEFTVSLVPVPPAAAMAGLGLAAVAWRRRKMASA